MLPETFIFVPALINLWSTGCYLAAVFRGEARPNRVTWFMWALAGLIAAAAQITAGIGLSTLIVFLSGFGPLVIFVCSFLCKKAYWKTTPFDYVCGVLALCGIVGWWLTREENFAIAFSIAADFCAMIPTLRKSYADPKSENGPTYLLGAVSDIVALFCIQQQTFTAYAFTAYMAFTCTLLGAIIYGRNHILNRVNEGVIP